MWRKPTDEELDNEYTWESKHLPRGLFRDKAHFIESAKRSQLVDMPDNVARATKGGTIDDVKEMVSTYAYPRDVDLIVHGLKNQSLMPSPIVLHTDNGHFMMSGNTRQHLADIHGIKPKVLLIDVRTKKEPLDKTRSILALKKGAKKLKVAPSTAITTDNAHPHFHSHHFDLIDGLDLQNAEDREINEGVTQGVGVYKHPKGHSVFVKPDISSENFEEAFLAPASLYKRHGLDKFTTSHREAAFHSLATDFFGIPHSQIPRTTAFKRDGINHSAQEFADDAMPGFTFSADDVSDGFEIQRMAVVDAILGNNDRHSGNYMSRNGLPLLIDHGFTFDYHEKPLGIHGGAPAYTRGMDDHITHSVPEESTIEWLDSLDANKFEAHMKKIGIPKKHRDTALLRLHEAKISFPNEYNIDQSIKHIKDRRHK